ncbi:hypothetical protein MBM_05760 [Drepanopeziza brunnea f. sp. 'multigermtubi' MB_m1]|uniref:Centromere protein H C-terminal domain-containing protein n=1 Tax=Marssonina brunnea f. sp. multigermtubi (strain MB_m1) TaxID=1072389 RepID=K1XTB7_MARBU|nr:uncharacterized protein MBM_05760 [Drepanopeziza brunnea f. sp. 'multigermtubi' MB_m1]EKD15749.1 hypothetical protein MBM_05760 [Drepanopeziza brunnea f. sp. 'multigermtubi' MB_m1]
MEKMEGVETTENETQIPPLLNEDERRILDAYDRLEELQLEIALLQAQGVLSKEVPQEASEKDIAAAKQELLQAKSHYLLRSNVIESVLIAPPILQAVHAGDKATVVEQDLFPLIQKRDQLAINLTKLSTEARSARDELTKVEVENVMIVRRNAELATTMLALAEEADTQRKEDIQDPALRHQLDELEAEMKRSRQKWRIMKGTASAIIAGSGVDWARNPDLLDIVLDNEGE